MFNLWSSDSAVGAGFVLCEAEAAEPVKLPRLSLVEARHAFFGPPTPPSPVIPMTCRNDPKPIILQLSSLSRTFLREKHDI